MPRAAWRVWRWGHLPLAGERRSVWRRGWSAARGIPPVRRTGRNGARPLLGSRHLRDDRVGHLAHTEPAVHGRLLDPPERVGLGQLEPRHEDALGPVDRLAGLEPLAEVGDLALERLELGPPRRGDVDRGCEVGLGERLDDVGHDTRVTRALDELLLAERGQHDDRRDALLADLL